MWWQIEPPGYDYLHPRSDTKQQSSSTRYIVDTREGARHATNGNLRTNPIMKGMHFLFFTCAVLTPGKILLQVCPAVCSCPELAESSFVYMVTFLSFVMLKGVVWDVVARYAYEADWQVSRCAIPRQPYHVLRICCSAVQVLVSIKSRTSF